MKSQYELWYKLSLKCVLVGDTCVGKSCLATRLCHHEFKPDYTPTLFDNFAVTVIKDDLPYNLSIFDTAGQESHSKLRILSYDKCDVFIVIFDISIPETLRSVKEFYVPEIRCHSPATPVILVGAKTDLRKTLDQKQAKGEKANYVTSKQGAEAAADIGAVFYVECSALTREGIDDVSMRVIEGFLQSKETIEGTTTGCCACIIM